jgi:hypothetical protein
MSLFYKVYCSCILLLLSISYRKKCDKEIRERESKGERGVGGKQ